MKKVAIITYHKVYNCGSSLQAYATLQTFLKLGIDVTIINYVPERFKNYGSFRQTFAEKRYFSNTLKALIVTLLSYKSRKKQKQQFDKFDKYLHLGNEIYDEELSLMPEYDIYFTGSDQVWNDYFGGFEKAYFLDFVKHGKPCYAYSASFGKSQFSVDEKNRLRQLLSKYSKISVRENTGKQILAELDIKSVQLLDPIYVLSRDEWSKIAESPIEGKYILIYQISHKSNCIEYAKHLSTKVGGLPIYFIEYERRPHKDGINYFSAPTVNQFLGLIRNATYMITDSFHGTSFSLKFNRTFFAIMPPAFPGRLKSILDLLGLQNRIVSSVSELDDKLSDNINWEKVNLTLNVEAVKNISFIKKCISENE